ncbi:hypothetical protein B0H19DRAFT_648074 [Mycena capillaripes]|nr:hypothetical protein B0H19DRAFT_648074 [Mycena capillaripes]
MPTTHLLSSTLLAFIPCTDSIVQYVVLVLLTFYSGILLTRPFLPSARMHKLETQVAETTDMLQSANEERMLRSNREFNLDIQLRLSKVNLTKSTLRLKILKFGLGYAPQEYLHMMGVLSRDIERCKREAKEIQIAILTEMEKERQLLYNADIDDMNIILSSSVSTRRIQSEAQPVLQRQFKFSWMGNFGIKRSGVEEHQRSSAEGIWRWN